MAAIVGALEILILPLAMLTSFRSLRFTSMLCFCSVMGVTACVMANLFGCIAESGHTVDMAVLWPRSTFGVLRALPVLICTFLCHFNVLAVQSELEDPSRGRLKAMVHGAVGTACIIYFSIGLSGAMYSNCRHCRTEDNILMEFSPSQLSGKVVLAMAKCMIASTLVFALPMIAAPCRDTMLRLWSMNWDASSGELQGAGDDIKNPLMDPLSGAEDPAPFTANALNSPARPREDSAVSSVESVSHEKRNNAGLIVLTAAIFVLQFTIALYTPSVSTVWAFIGSIVGPIIAFVIPSASYLMITSPADIQGRKQMRRRTTWLLLVVSILAMVACTCITITDLMA